MALFSEVDPTAAAVAAAHWLQAAADVAAEVITVRPGVCGISSGCGS
jgi:hypothetical protein